jgi:signal transduction histidine kinase
MNEYSGSEIGNAESTFIPGSVVSLSSILYTEELYRRPSRPIDYAKENRALRTLNQALADSPSTILQTLADIILEGFQAGSAGISLLTPDDGGKRFYWPAIAGKWKPYIGGGTPRDFGPCGDVLDRNAPLLMRHVERRYTYFQPVKPLIEEVLLVPFYIEGKAVGTLWAVAHDNRRKFDAEDERLMTSLGKFSSSAYQVLGSLDALKSQVTERTQAEKELRNSERQLRTLAETLEIQVRVRTQQLEERNAEVLLQTEQLRELSNRLLRTQDDERRRIARELHDSVGQIVTALSLNLASITPRVKRHAVIGKSINESLDLIRQLGNEIRTISYLLHPPLLDENGLSVAIEWYAAGVSKRSGLQIGLEISEKFGRLSGEMETALFRIVQECLTNIHRHSGSKTATIQLLRHANSISLELQDAGKGIPAEKLAGIQAQRSGVGVAGMRERVRHLKGSIDIQTNPDGTRVCVTLPITATPELAKTQRAATGA